MLGTPRRPRRSVPPERQDRFAVSVVALRMHLARLRGDLDGALELGRALLRDGQLEATPSTPACGRSRCVHLGIAELWAGDAEEAEHHLERARGAAAEAGRDWLVLIAVAHLALLGCDDERLRALGAPGARRDRARRGERLGPDVARRRRLPRAGGGGVPLGPRRRRRRDARARPGRR